MDNAETPRDVYRSSGRVRWSLFVPGFLAAAVCAIILAWLLNVALAFGFYLIFVAPLIAALLLGAFWLRILGWSHCRNVRLAAISSVILGLTLYLGHYHLGLLQLIGYENAHRVDALPRYIAFRMQTDIPRNVHEVGAKQRKLVAPNMITQGFNWLFFGGEMVCVAGLMLALAVTRSSRAYCESCGHWMASEALNLPPGMATLSWEALTAGEHADAQGRFLVPTQPNLPHGMLTIEHCPKCPSAGRASVVYLTVKDFPLPDRPAPHAAEVVSALKGKSAGKVRTIVDHVALDPEEAGAYARSFPWLGHTIEANPTLFARERSAVQELAKGETVASGFHDRPVRTFATVEDVDPGEAGVILTGKNTVLQTILAIVTNLGGIMLALIPLFVVVNLQPTPPDWTVMVAVAWTFVCMGLSIVWALYFGRYPTSRFMARKTRQALEMRANPVIDLNDPELVFVDIIPRTNWGKPMLENATDIGFLQFNRTRRELAFEGDRQRYRIPIESILSVEHETWSEPGKHALQSAPSLNHVIVVRAMTKDGPWETWFYQRWNTLRPFTEKGRLDDAATLEFRIRELMACG